MCQARIMRFMCCYLCVRGGWAAFLTLLWQTARYHMQSHQKTPRTVAHGALMLWEGPEDEEEAKLAKAGTQGRGSSILSDDQQNCNVLGVGR